jgi:hypothetical protein
VGKRWLGRNQTSVLAIGSLFDAPAVAVAVAVAVAARWKGWFSQGSASQVGTHFSATCSRSARTLMSRLRSHDSSASCRCAPRYSPSDGAVQQTAKSYLQRGAAAWQCTEAHAQYALAELHTV